MSKLKTKIWKDEVDQIETIYYVPIPGKKINYQNTGDFIWHREDGPAYDSIDGDYRESSWWYNDVMHRYDGPAHYMLCNGEESYTWFIWDNEVDPDEYLSWIEEMGIDLKNLSEADEALIKLRWCNG